MMKKLRLELDMLIVQTFATQPDHEASRRGTVRGHDYTEACPSQMAGCTGGYCAGTDAISCVGCDGGGPPPSWSCIGSCEHAD